MRDISLEELLEAGCHFGHQTTRQNPKARDYVFEARDGIHIIDLAKTKEGLDESLAYIKSVAQQENSTLLVVGTKRQAAPIIEEEVVKTNEQAANSVFSVTKRWIGGTLTNTQAVQKNFAKLKDLEKRLQSEEEKEKYTKKEIGDWQKELSKLQYYYSGVVNMTGMPTVMFIVDTHMEYLAVAEANRMGIPIVGIVDTNADPDPIQYVIPANDDAVGSLKLLIGAVMDAWIEGKTGKEVKRAKEKAAESTEEVKEEKKTKKASTKKAKTDTKEEEMIEIAEETVGAEEMTDESPVKTTKKKKVASKK